MAEKNRDLSLNENLGFLFIFEWKICFFFLGFAFQLLVCFQVLQVRRQEEVYSEL